MAAPSGGLHQQWRRDRSRVRRLSYSQSFHAVFSLSLFHPSSLRHSSLNWCSITDRLHDIGIHIHPSPVTQLCLPCHRCLPTSFCDKIIPFLPEILNLEYLWSNSSKSHRPLTYIVLTTSIYIFIAIRLLSLLGINTIIVLSLLWGQTASYLSFEDKNMAHLHALRPQSVDASEDL
jgi:hypothetical protein